MYPGFVLIRSGKVHKHRNDHHEGRSLYSQIPRKRRHGIPCRATQGSTKVSQEAEGERRELPRAEPFLGFSKEGMGEAGQVG